MSVNRRSWSLLTFLALLASSPVLASTYLQEHRLSFKVKDGLQVENLLYAQVKPGEKWVLHVSSNRGMTVLTEEGVAVTDLEGDQIASVVAGAVNEIEQRFEGGLDSIRISMAGSTHLLQGATSALREADISNELVVEQKSKEVSSVLKSYLTQTSVVRSICKTVESLNKVCVRDGVSINPVAFERGNLGRSWQSVKAEPHLGLATEHLDFVILLE